MLICSQSRGQRTAMYKVLRPRLPDSPMNVQLDVNEGRNDQRALPICTYERGESPLETLHGLVKTGIYDGRVQTATLQPVAC